MEALSLIPPSSVPILPGEGEERVLRILESITDGLYCFDAEWRFTFINEAGKRVLAANLEDPDQLLGQNYWEAFPATLGGVIDLEFHRAVRDQTAVQFEVFYPPWNRWFSVRGYPIRGGGLSVYFREVTEEKEAADALRTSEERYRNLFNSIDEAFCVIEMIWDLEGRPVDYRFLEINPAFATHTGLTDAVGHTVKELNPNHEAHWFEIYGQVSRTGQPVRFTEGSESLGRWFDVYAFAIGPLGKRHIAVKFTDVTSQRKSDRELVRLSQENRSRLVEIETLLDVLPIGIAIANDPECRNIRLNSAFSKLLEIPQGVNASKTAPEDEIPTNFRVFDDFGNEIPSDQLPMQTAAREGREIRDFELNIVHADGRKMRLLEYIAPLFDEQGKTRGSVGAFVDITQRQEEEARQKFFVALDDAVRPLGSAEEIVATSARLLGEHLKVDRCAYADVEADEDTMNITGDFTRGVPSIVGRFTFTEFGTEVLTLMRKNQPFVVEDIGTHQPPPESLEAYHATMIRSVICVPLHKADRFVGAMAVHMKTPRRWTEDEVSLVLQVANRSWEALERAKVTRELRQSEERFRQIADIMPQVVWLANPDGYVSYYNRRWYEFTGRPEGEVGNDSWLAVMHPDDVEPSATQWAEAVKGGKFYETRYRWQDHFTGDYCWYLARGVPLRNERGEIIRWYGTSTDIDDLVRAEKAASEARAVAERASRAKDEFLAALSHELRTPLTPVLMAAEDLCEDPALPTAVNETLCMMRRNITLEARLIDDLLDLTRITHGKLALRLQEADAHTLLGLAVEIVRDEAQAKGLVLAVDLQAENTHLQCDPARVQQVFWNLLKNAVKFTPARGRIEIRSRDLDGHIQVEIQDSGIGMAAETLERIFLPFEQAGLVNDHRFGGLGLGLSISKAVVDMHGGSISADSAGLNCGATFQVVLPATVRQAENEAGDDRAMASAAPAQDKEAVSKLRLLVVEDHEPTLAVLTRLLGRAGHHVIPAASVATALEMARLNTFDFVVSDIGLPDGSGIELMKKLSTDYGLCGVALSGYGMEEDQQKAFEAGFTAHLTKPVDFAQLRRVLAQAAQA